MGRPIQKTDVDFAQKLLRAKTNLDFIIQALVASGLSHEVASWLLKELQSGALPLQSPRTKPSQIQPRTVTVKIREPLRTQAPTRSQTDTSNLPSEVLVRVHVDRKQPRSSTVFQRRMTRVKDLFFYTLGTIVALVMIFAPIQVIDPNATYDVHHRRGPDEYRLKGTEVQKKLEHQKNIQRLIGCALIVFLNIRYAWLRRRISEVENQAPK